jgi:hypothetical protein
MLFLEALVITYDSAISCKMTRETTILKLGSVFPLSSPLINSNERGSDSAGVSPSLGSILRLEKFIRCMSRDWNLVYQSSGNVASAFLFGKGHFSNTNLIRLNYGTNYDVDRGNLSAHSN